MTEMKLAKHNKKKHKEILFCSRFASVLLVSNFAPLPLEPPSQLYQYLVIN